MSRKLTHGNVKNYGTYMDRSETNKSTDMKNKASLTKTRGRTRTTFLTRLEQTVNTRNNKLFATWHDKNGKPSITYTYKEIWEEAGSISYTLRHEWSLQKGDRIIVMYLPGLQFFAAFLGCLRAGIIPVLVYPPNPSTLKRALSKLTKVVKDCDAKLILIDSSVNTMRLVYQFSNWPKVEYRVHPSRSRFSTFFSLKKIGMFTEKDLFDDDVAFLQYTSGSTGDPKGVMVNFAALESNVTAILDGSKPRIMETGVKFEDIITMTWLPQYHDMGLVAGLMAPFTAGFRCHQMSPITFIQNPDLWMELMSSLGAHWSAGPDFAFALCARKFLEKGDRRKNSRPESAPLDLSSIICLQNGAEPIRVETKELFDRAFLPHGLRKDWFSSVYGMAENVVYISHSMEFRLSRFQPASGKSLIAVGHRDALPSGQQIKIVSIDTCTELADKEIGEIWISGPSITAGYYKKPQLNKEVFNATLKGSNKIYLRTGDLGMYEENYLYICGRAKDLIIVNGVNYYPQDIEDVVSNITSVRPGCVAAFSSNDGDADGELEVVFEIRESALNMAEHVVDEVRHAIINQVGVLPSRIVAIKERSILKTTSGKIQRKANRNALHKNSHRIINEYTIGTSGVSNKTINEATTEKLDFDGIIASFFGSGFDRNSDWESLGMSSIVSVQLRDTICNSYPIVLDSDCFLEYRTPSTLKEYIITSQGRKLHPVTRDDLPRDNSRRFAWALFGIMQCILSFAVLLIFSFAIVPAWYVGKLFVNDASPSDANTTVIWRVLPIAIPAWILAYSISVISLKWSIIGKYQEVEVDTLSLSYLRWWFIDRAIDLWERVIGRFVLGTPLMNIFYYMMGANMRYNVIINNFVREFDLVHIGSRSTINHPLKCHRFGVWKNGSTTLSFRSIKIEKNCTIKGFVSLGACVKSGARSESLSMIPEGATLPSSSRVISNTSVFVESETSIEKGQQYSWWTLSILKVLFLIMEMYHFFALSLLGFYLWGTDYLYKHPVLLWTGTIFWSSAMSVITGIILKWALIGKKKPGSFDETLASSFFEWCVDWHSAHATFVIYYFTFNSRVWNCILRLYGMDIDFSSKVFPGDFLPSQLDLIKVKNSFISNLTYDSRCNDSSLQPIVIQNSSIGNKCHLGLSSITIDASIISPRSYISKNNINYNGDTRMPSNSALRQIMSEVIIGLLLFLFCNIGLFLTSLVPSYILWQQINPSSVWFTVPTLTLCLSLHVITAALISSAIQSITLFTTSMESQHQVWSPELYASYQILCSCFDVFTVMSVFNGSQAFNFLLKIMGATFKGKAIILSQYVFEHAYLVIEDKTIVDGSNLTGHYSVYDKITVGPCRVQGTLHPDTIVTCADIRRNESGPSTIYVATYSNPRMEKKSSFNAFFSFSFLVGFLGGTIVWVIMSSK